MLTNEQRAHDVAILQLQFNVPVMQRRFSHEQLKVVNLAEEYLEIYNATLTTIEARLNQSKK